MKDIATFWMQHYEFENITTEIKAIDVYDFFRTTTYFNDISFTEFKEFSGRVPDLQSVYRNQNQFRIYKVSPATQLCKNFHNDLSPTANNTNPSNHNHNQFQLEVVKDTSTITNEMNMKAPNQSTTLRSSKNSSSDHVKEFWEANYVMDGVDEDLALNEVFYYFQTTNDYQGETLDQFKQISMSMIPALVKAPTPTSGKLLRGKPKTFHCYLMHQKAKDLLRTDINKNKPSINTQNWSNEIATPKPSQEVHNLVQLETSEYFKTTDLFLLNVQGLVTNKRNKCSFLKEVTASEIERKSIAITETWGNKHYDTEYLKAFKGYNMTKADRDTTNATLDGKCLSKNGGVLLLTSKDIPQKPILKFSNGNCELIISELPTIKTTVIVFYRPSGKNFSLQKYNEALKHVHDYLRNNRDKEENMEILFMGDFNFTKAVVQWVKSDDSLIPNYNEGITPEKQGFNTLLNITEDFDLKQVVNKPTHGDNTLATQRKWLRY